MRYYWDKRWKDKGVVSGAKLVKEKERETRKKDKEEKREKDTVMKIMYEHRWSNPKEARLELPERERIRNSVSGGSQMTYIINTS